MAGISSGPTPWWTAPGPGGGGAAALQRLTSNAPPGYEYDPVQMGYVRTPTAAGTRVAQFDSAALGGIPSLAGLATGGGTGGGVSTSGITGGTGAGGPVGSGTGVAPMTMPDTTAANNAALAAAKDNAGKIARSSIQSLNGELGASGMLGSGAQVQGTKDIINDAASQVGDVNRTNLTNQEKLAEDTAKTNYEGALTQRGQDIQAQEANAQLALESRNQMYQLLNLALKGLGGGANFMTASPQQY